MTVIQIVELILWEFCIPAAVGTIFWGIKKHTESLPFQWVSGQLLLWTLFMLLCLPLTIRKVDFIYLVWIYTALVAGLLLVSGGLYLRWRGKRRGDFRVVYQEDQTEKKTAFFLWLIFWGLLLFQLFQAVRLAYGDGDDAYYVAVTTTTNNAGTMYRKIPYTGVTTELDVRHALAPFPVWIAYLAQVTGAKSAAVAHVAVPLMLISMTYAIFFLIAEKLFWRKKDRIPLFLIFTELLALFGDYSYYTAENFMLARSRQGKAALGNIVIPVLFLLLLSWLEALQEKRKLSLKYWVLLFSTMTTACLCSTLGAVLSFLLVAVTGSCAAAVYREWRILIPLGVCCAPCIVVAELYLHI